MDGWWSRSSVTYHPPRSCYVLRAPAPRHQGQSAAAAAPAASALILLYFRVPYVDSEPWSCYTLVFLSFQFMNAPYRTGGLPMVQNVGTVRIRRGGRGIFPPWEVVIRKWGREVVVVIPHPREEGGESGGREGSTVAAPDRVACMFPGDVCCDRYRRLPSPGRVGSGRGASFPACLHPRGMFIVTSTASFIPRVPALYSTALRIRCSFVRSHRRLPSPGRFLPCLHLCHVIPPDSSRSSIFRRPGAPRVASRA